MPVTKSAKKALRTATRRHEENLIQRDAIKKNLKAVRKAVDSGSQQIGDLLSQAFSSLDKAAKKNTIHPNKAARLKSRLAKKIATAASAPVVEKKVTKRASTKTTTKKKTAKK